LGSWPSDRKQRGKFIPAREQGGEMKRRAELGEKSVFGKLGKTTEGRRGVVEGWTLGRAEERGIATPYARRRLTGSGGLKLEAGEANYGHTKSRSWKGGDL